MQGMTDRCLLHATRVFGPRPAWCKFAALAAAPDRLSAATRSWPWATTTRASCFVRNSWRGQRGDKGDCYVPYAFARDDSYMLERWTAE